MNIKVLTWVSAAFRICTIFICRQCKLILIKLRGVELPINVIVLVVLCIIVLLSVTVLFILTWNPSSGTISLESAKVNTCQKLAMSNCQPSTSSIFVENFDANKDGKLNENGNAVDASCSGGGDDNLYMLCSCWFGISDEQSCKNSVCDCQSASVSNSASSSMPPPPPSCTIGSDCPSGHCSGNRCI